MQLLQQQQKSNFSAHKKIVHEKTKFSIEQITWDK